jgi:glycosyltransferase involved in cell wall biosynthesis
MPFSIIVICKNEVDALATSIPVWLSVSNEVIVYDTGSVDGSQDLIKKLGATLAEGPWEGFGRTKNKASQLASHDWILSLDADETPDDALRSSLKNWAPPADNSTVYNLRFRNYFSNKPLYFGEWGRDSHLRLFNRKYTKWNEALVHEKLLFANNSPIATLWGYVTHRTVKDIDEYKEKTNKYALLSAEKYFLESKKATWIKLYVSPIYSFVHYYILKLGFLDGTAGLICAGMTTRYTYLKYRYLKKLMQKENA